MIITLIVVLGLSLVLSFMAIRQRIVFTNKLEKCNSLLEEANIKYIELESSFTNLSITSEKDSKELCAVKERLDHLLKLNDELIDELYKKEDIKLTVTGANSQIKIIDNDSPAKPARKRGRKPGVKKSVPKKKG